MFLHLSLHASYTDRSEIGRQNFWTHLPWHFLNFFLSTSLWLTVIFSNVGAALSTLSNVSTTGSGSVVTLIGSAVLRLKIRLGEKIERLKLTSKGQSINQNYDRRRIFFDQNTLCTRLLTKVLNTVFGILNTLYLSDLTLMVMTSGTAGTGLNPSGMLSPGSLTTPADVTMSTESTTSNPVRESLSVLSESCNIRLFQFPFIL